MNDTELAAALVGTTQPPEGLSTVIEEAARALAYHKRKPYPTYAYKTWDKETLGPLPMCPSIPRKCVRRGARFLFGKGVEIKCAGNDALEAFLRDAWAENQMPARMVALAEKGGIEGNVVLKFAWNPDETPRLSIQTLSLVDQVRLFHHPHNRQKVLMARVQYPYWDAELKGRYWYREEWTAQRQITYAPVPYDKAKGAEAADKHEGWQVKTDIENPFGLIPLTLIKNIETDDTFGVGDLWELWEDIDALSLVIYQMRRSNQFDSELNPWIIDGELDDDDADGPLKPGETANVKSSSDDVGKQAKVVFSPGGNALRDSMMDYAKYLQKMFEEAGGTSTVDAAEVTNKGNLTVGVLMQLYQVALELLEEKKKSYGQNGIELFLEGVAKGLFKNGEKGLGITDAPDSWNVEVVWPAPFEMTGEEKQAAVTRINTNETNGYLPHDRAVEAVAHIEGIRDIKQLKEELAKEPKPEPAPAPDPNAPDQGGKQPPND